MFKRIVLYLCTLLALQVSLSSMVSERFPMLKRLASEAYWKYNDRMPATGQINDEVRMLLITYAPLYESTITEVFKNSKFLNDVARTGECKEFIAENIVRGSKASILMTGIKNGILLHPAQAMSTVFSEVKKRRFKSFTETANIRPDELAIDIGSNEQEENIYGASAVSSVILCKILPLSIAITVGIPFALIKLFN